MGAHGLGCDAPVAVLPAPLAGGLRLWPAYPNPFNPATTIRFELAEAARVRLEVFTLAGGRVASLVEAHLAAGEHSVTWHGRDGNGRRLATGTYIYRVVAGSRSEARRMTLVQ